MRKLMILILLAALLALPALAELRPNVVIDSYAVTEGAIAPGQDFTLAVTLRNVETGTCAYATTATVQVGTPFILRGPATFSAGKLCEGDTAVIAVPLRIDPAASGGSSQLDLAFSYDSSTLIQFSGSAAVTLLVEGFPRLEAHLVGARPVDVYPGDTATLTVSVENTGAFEARSVTAALSSDTAVEVAKTDGFAALGLLAAKGSTTTEFTVDVPKDAASGDYPLDLALAYQDENLAQRIQDVALTFHVKERAKFDAADAGTGMLYANQNGRLVKLTVTNTGTDAARKLRVKILPQYPFSTDGSVRYVESLAPGKSAPVEFTVDIDKDGTPGTYGLDLLVQYEDPQGKSFQDTATFPLTVAPTGFFRGVFLNYWYLWTVALIIVLLVLSKRKKK